MYKTLLIITEEQEKTKHITVQSDEHTCSHGTILTNPS